MSDERPIRLLVCGGRAFDNVAFLHRALGAMQILAPIGALIEGGATGADSLARTWATHRDIPVITERADWKAHGRGAGPRRNQKMLDDHRPDVVIAFAGGAGTGDMVKRAKAAGVPVFDFRDWPADA